MKLNNLIFLCVLVLNFFPSKAQEKNTNFRIVVIGGLIVDTENFSPLKGAKIFDKNENLLGITDEKGYFKVKLRQEIKGNFLIYFSVKKQNYESITLKENWGNFGKDIKASFISGLNKKNFKEKIVFTNLEISEDNSYRNVVSKFNALKKIKSLENRIRKAAEGNEKVFFEIDGAYYIVYEKNWLKIETKNEIVSIDRKITMQASELNSKIKRSEIVFISNFNNKPFKILINTK
ncbi:hypothetical protein [Aureivirga marina]|uniref:hypothetical protein n=1 Tax=Aureivirga marina TaxID=1182451 RepID=UPI0018CBEE2A|nr:hypothetical protein [Aureivirga marina]